MLNIVISDPNHWIEEGFFKGPKFNKIVEVITAINAGGGAPDPHKTTHEDEGTDEISVAGLSGELADGQPPKDHASSHHTSGSDLLSHQSVPGAGTKSHPTLDTEVAANTTHKGSDGKDHSDVVLNNTHRGSDGKDHSDVVANTTAIGLNTTHRGSDGKNHSDVVANTAVNMIGSSNAQWVQCAFMSINLPASHTVMSTSAGNSNFGSTDDWVSYSLTIPTTRGGLSLYISGVRLTINDADASNRIERFFCQAQTYNTAITLYEDNSAGGTTPQLMEDGSGSLVAYGTADDVSGYTSVTFNIYFVGTTTNSCDWFYPEFKCYYA